MRRLAVLLIFALLGVLLPLAGAYLAGEPIEPYLRFPGEPRPARSSFDWAAFVVYAAIIAAVVAPFVWRVAAARPGPSAFDVLELRFPWWGWAGFGVTVIAWVLAWSRLPQFQGYPVYTFTPLWLGYILVVNGLAFRRTGRCLLLDRPVCFAALFPASAAFWWYFEYLNRYTGNWYYVGVELLSPFEYFVHASISFSTVLPAVASTREWLGSFARLQAAFTRFWPVRFADSSALSWALLGLGALGLVLLGIWPAYAYSLVWAAPLFLLLALMSFAGLPSPLGGLERGDWRGLVLPALAALFAGFFWEMWNWQSFAHWQYAVPLVYGFRIFEMPLLGYAGYLPFGIICVAISALVCGWKERRAGP